MYEITFKTVSGAVAELQLKDEVVDLNSLQCYILGEWGWRLARVLKSGREIYEGELITLEPNGSNVFYVVPRRSFHRQEVVEEKIDEGERTVEESTEEESICRICFEGGSFPDNKLFSPCLCKGSMKFVHVKCLDAWRLHATSSQSYYSCGQCQYRYNLIRTEAAKVIYVLGSDVGCYTISFLFVSILIILISEFLSLQPLSLFMTSYGFQDFHKQVLPLWILQYLPEKYLLGVFAVGLVGGAVQVFNIIRSVVPDDGDIVGAFFENPNLLLMGASLATHSGTSFSKSAIGVGIYYCLFKATQSIKQASKIALRRWGEFIVEVHN